MNDLTPATSSVSTASGQLNPPHNTHKIGFWKSLSNLFRCTKGKQEQTKKKYIKKNDTKRSKTTDTNTQCVRKITLENSCVNFIYSPRNKGPHDVECIVIKLDKKAVLTIYSSNIYLPAYQYWNDSLTQYKVIKFNDTGHLEKLHKRINPLATHVHFEASEYQDINLFLTKCFTTSGLIQDQLSEFYATIDFLSKKPDEPGLVFKSGSISLNGGASDFHGNNQNIQGPCMLFENTVGDTCAKSRKER